MADPLSSTASAIAVCTLIIGTISAIEGIRKLPRAIEELLEEVAELALVLQHVDSFLRSTSSQSQQSLIPGLDTPRILEMVEVIRSTLSEVDELLQQHVVGSPTNHSSGDHSGTGKIPPTTTATATAHDIARSAKPEKFAVKINWGSGKKTLLRISSLRKKLQSVGRSLLFALAVISGARCTHLDEMVHDLVHTASTFRIDFTNHFHQLRGSVDTLSHNIEATLPHMLPQTLQLAQIQAILLENKHAHAGDLLAMDPEKSHLSLSDLEKQIAPKNDLSLSRFREQRLGRRAERRRVTYCSPTCICSCHVRTAISTHPCLNPIFGTLNVDMVASRLNGSRCSERSCQIRGPTAINIEYVFPLWLFMMLISISIQVPKLSNLTLNIRAARVRSDSALIFRFAMEGNADGIRDLFNKGLASPFDVDASTKTSALVYATGWHHAEVWKLLLEAGADPYQESSTRHSPMVNVWRSLLEAGVIQKTLGKTGLKKGRQDGKVSVPEETLMALKNDFDLEEYMERRQFPILHQIVMGLVDADLETQLKLSTAQVDSVDQQGLTALSWAATTGDIESVETLLKYGANPNLVACNGDMPLHYAVRTVDPGCIEPLIRYRADVDAKNAWAVTPLHYATMNRDDLRHVIPLVEANANVNLLDQHGRTPLFRAVKYNRPNIVRYILEHNAHLLIDRWGQHPLELAVDSGFHEVFDVILSYGGHQLTVDHINASLLRAEGLEDKYTIRLLQEKLPDFSRPFVNLDEIFDSLNGDMMEEKQAVTEVEGL